jgi:hypothetical protein
MREDCLNKNGREMRESRELRDSKICKKQFIKLMWIITEIIMRGTRALEREIIRN